MEEPFDYVIVSIKTLPQLYSVPDIIRPAITPKRTCIIHNSSTSLGAEDQIISAFPNNLIISLVSFLDLAQCGPLAIEHRTGYDLKIGIVEASGRKLPQEARKDAIDCLVLMAEAGKLNCSVHDNILGVMWDKMLGHILFDSVAAITSITNNATLVENPAISRLLGGCLDELLNVASADGRLDPDQCILYRENLIPKMAKLAPSPASSLRIDASLGRPLELSTTIGYPITIAEKHHVPIPRLETLHALLCAVDATNSVTTKKPKSKITSSAVPTKRNSTQIPNMVKRNHPRVTRSHDDLTSMTQKKSVKQSRHQFHANVGSPTDSHSSAMSNDPQTLQDLADLVITPEQLDFALDKDSDDDELGVTLPGQTKKTKVLSRPIMHPRSASEPLDQRMYNLEQRERQLQKREQKLQRDIESRYAKALEDGDDDSDDDVYLDDSASTRERAASSIGYHLPDNVELDDVDVMSLTGRRTRQALMGSTVDSESRAPSAMSMRTGTSGLSISTLHTGRLRSPAVRSATALALSSPLGTDFRSDSLESYAAVLYSPESMRKATRPRMRSRNMSTPSEAAIQYIPTTRAKLRNSAIFDGATDRYQTQSRPTADASISSVQSYRSGAPIRPAARHSASLPSMPPPALSRASDVRSTLSNSAKAPHSSDSSSSATAPTSPNASSPTISSPSIPKPSHGGSRLAQTVTPPTSADEDEEAIKVTSRIPPPPMEMWMAKEPFTVQSKPTVDRKNRLATWGRKLGLGF